MHLGGWYQNRVLLGVLKIEDALGTSPQPQPRVGKRMVIRPMGMDHVDH